MAKEFLPLERVTAVSLRSHEGAWQVLMGEKVVVTAERPDSAAAAAASLHVTLLEDGLLDADQGIELAGDASEEHLRVAYAALQRLDLFERRS